MSKMDEQISRADQLAGELHKTLGSLLAATSDYDIQRILKRSEAEVMDLRHNLTLIRRLKGE